MNKLRYKIQLKYTFFLRNRLRSTLSIIGCAIGILLVGMGKSGIDGYEEKLLKKAWLHPDNMLLISSLPDEEYNRFMNSQSGCREDIYYTGFGKLLANKTIYKGQSIKIGMQFIGTGANDFSSFVFSESGVEHYVTGCELIYGRGLEERDITEHRRVVVIEEATAMLCFGTVDCIGEKLMCSSVWNAVDYEVIGVIKNLESHNRDILDINKNLKSGEDFNLSLGAYIPLTTLLDEADCAIWKIRTITYRESAAEAGEILSKIVREKGVAYRYSTRYSLLCEAENEFATYRWCFGLIAAIIIIFSCMFLTTTWIFSIKERVPEIGIRRALGATKSMILEQFMMEGVLVGCVAAIVDIVILLYASTMIKILMTRVFFLDYEPVVSSRLILSLLGLGILEGTLFSVAPAIVAANTSPAVAVKWE